MVFRGSRYQGVMFTGIIGKDGKVRKFLHQRDPLTLVQMSDPVISHPYQTGEVIDELAWKAASKPRLWWIIADISDLLFPLEIDPGAQLFIPIQELNSRLEIG